MRTLKHNIFQLQMSTELKVGHCVYHGSVSRLFYGIVKSMILTDIWGTK